MQNILSAYIDTNYLIFVLSKSESEQYVLKHQNNERFPLYFYLDKLQSKISFNTNFKPFYLENKLEFIGDFWEKLSAKQTYLWENKKNNYSELLNLIFEELKTKVYQFIETSEVSIKLIFSDNIIQNLRTIIEKKISSQGFEIVEQELCFSELVIKNHIEEKSLYIQDKKFVVLEALEDNLNISIVQVKENQASRIEQRTFAKHGIDPKKYVIAKEIVDDISRSAKIHSVPEMLENEYKRHQLKAEKIISQLDNFDKNILSVSTSLAEDLQKIYITKINISEINKLVEIQAKKILATFADNFKIKITDIDKIFLVGDALNNELVKNEFSQFGQDKIIYFTNDIGSIIKTSLIEENPNAIDDEATMFLASDGDEQTTERQYSVVQTVNLSELEIGQYVKLTNNDPRPGKGESIQIFEYQGENKLKVIESTRSLKKNDIIELSNSTWHQGIQVVLKIYRKNSYKGKFKTREIQKIEIS